MLKVLLTERAQNDLYEAWAFIAHDSPSTADEVIRRMHEKMDQCGEFAEIGRERPEFGAGIRGLATSGYLILYRVAGIGIIVMRIVHSARSIENILAEGDLA